MVLLEYIVCYKMHIRLRYRLPACLPACLHPCIHASMRPCVHASMPMHYLACLTYCIQYYLERSTHGHEDVECTRAVVTTRIGTEDSCDELKRYNTCLTRIP